MDSFEYPVNGYLRTQILTRLTHTLYASFINQIIGGTVTNYAIANFFQQDSDFIVRTMYYPVKTDLFVKNEYVSHYLTIGTKVASFGTDDTKEIVKWYNSIELFNISVSRYFNNFLDFSPYTKITLFIPYFPEINLTPEEIYGRYIKCYISLDFSSGKATVYVYSNASSTAPDSVLLDTKTAQIGIDIPLGKTNAEEQQRNKVLNGIDATIGFGGLALGGMSGSGLVTAGGLGMIGKTIKNELNNNITRLTSYTGGTGNHDMLAVVKQPMLIIQRPQNVKYPDLHLKGKPCRKNLPLSSVTGYTEIGEIHFNPSGYEIYDDEIEEISGDYQIAE